MRTKNRLTLGSGLPWVTLGTLILASAPALLSQQQVRIVTGVIVDSSGTPVAGAKITMTSSVGSPLGRRGTTDERGQYRLNYPVISNVVDLRVEKEGFATLAERIDLRLLASDSSGRQRLDLVLEPAAETGRVATLLVDHPEHRDYSKGFEALQSGDLERARRRFQKAVERDPEFAPAHLGLALIALQEQRPVDAQREARATLALVPGLTLALEIDYSSARLLNDAAAAQLALDALAAGDPSPGTATLLFNDGIDALQAGKAAVARQRCEQAIRHDPELLPPKRIFAVLLLQDQAYADAIAQSDEVLAVEPHDLKMLQVQVEAWEGLGDDEAARRARERVAEAESQP